jgi:hypothetical protein
MGPNGREGLQHLIELIAGVGGHHGGAETA